MAGTHLQRGGNIALTKIAPGISRIAVALGWSPHNEPGMEVDASAFALTANGKVRGDSDLVFYNNPCTPEGSIEALADPASAGGADAQVFALVLTAIPEEVQRIAFTVTIYEGQERGQSFGMLSSAWARVINTADGTELARFELPLAGTPETAMIFCEVYRHRGDWKFRAVGQGYIGGLEPLATGFGVNVADEPGESTPTEQPPEPVSDISPPPEVSPCPAPASTPITVAADTSAEVERHIAELEDRAPDLAKLVREASAQLEQHGLHSHQAKVALCLDISGSMQGLYHKGAIDVLVRRVLALGLACDDAAVLDVFLFGAKAHRAGVVNTDNYQHFVADMLSEYRLESGTCYGKAMQIIRESYRSEPFFDHVPIYVLFVTDGDTSDRQLSERQITEAEREGIFWQFLAIGEPPTAKRGFFSKLLSSSFDFLTDLETKRNRLVYNTHFFLLRDPAEPSAEAFYSLLLTAYPDWFKAARAKAVLR